MFLLAFFFLILAVNTYSELVLLLFYFQITTPSPTEHSTTAENPYQTTDTVNDTTTQIHTTPESVLTHHMMSHAETYPPATQPPTAQPPTSQSPSQQDNTLRESAGSGYGSLNLTVVLCVAITVCGVTATVITSLVLRSKHRLRVAHDVEASIVYDLKFKKISVM